MEKILVDLDDTEKAKVLDQGEFSMHYELNVLKTDFMLPFLLKTGNVTFHRI